MEYANKDDIQDIVEAIEIQKKKAERAKDILDIEALKIETEKTKILVDILKMLRD